MTRALEDIQAVFTERNRLGGDMALVLFHCSIDACARSLTPTQKKSFMHTPTASYSKYPATPPYGDGDARDGNHGPVLAPCSRAPRALLAATTYSGMCRIRLKGFRATVS
jgi:hypothetical protein